MRFHPIVLLHLPIQAHNAALTIGSLTNCTCSSSWLISCITVTKCLKVIWTSSSILWMPCWHLTAIVPHFIIIPTCTTPLMPLHWVKRPGTISHSTTLVHCPRASPGRMHLDGWWKIMRSGFMIQSPYWRIYWQIPTSRMSSTTCPIKSMPLMGHINFVIWCQATGPGEKWYLSFLFDLHLSAYWYFTITQNTIIKDHLEAIGSFLVPMILGSNKTTVSVATGHTCYWPLYLSISNIHNNVHHRHWNGIVLLSFLAIPKSKPSIFNLTPMYSQSCLSWQWISQWW